MEGNVKIATSKNRYAIQRSLYECTQVNLVRDFRTTVVPIHLASGLQGFTHILSLRKQRE